MTPEEDEAFAAPAAARDRARAARAGAHPAPRQARRHQAHARRGARVRHRRRAGCSSTTSTSRPSALVARVRLLDGLLDLPGHQDGRAADGGDPAGVRHRPDDRQLRRRLGPLGPAEDVQDRPRDARRRLHRVRCGQGAVAQPGRVLRPERPARARRAARVRRRSAETFAGNSVLRGGGTHDAHLSYCTNVHPAEDLDGVVAQLDRYAEPVRRLVGVDVLGLGLWLPAALAGELADDAQAAPQAARRARRARARGVHAQRLPVRRLPRRGRQARRLPATSGRTRGGSSTRSTARSCSPTCCPTPRPTAASPRCRWPGARRGRRRRRDGGRARSPS